MAFNLAQYNLNPFNAQGGNVKWIRANGSETINSFIGSALEVYVLGIGNERVSEEITGAPTKFIKAKGTEKISELVANGQVTVLVYPVFEESVWSEIDLSAEVMPPAVLSEVVTAEPYLGADIYPVITGSETVDVDALLRANIYLSTEGFELVSESASLDIIDRKVCLLTTTLAPGHMIVIDADTYTVLLDGVNAIEIQSGEWIDELNRDTVDIEINAASGEANLSARLIYTERYL
jgi:hypothetical protein